MAKKKLTLDDIFNDDEFGLLESKAKTSNVRSDDDRLIAAFEEINVFYDKNGREPSRGSMSEYSLMAKLKNFKQDDKNKPVLKPYDRHNLLGEVETAALSIDDILKDDDLGLLDVDEDLSIFKFNHTPKEVDRAASDTVARRKKMKEKDFLKYEKMFQKVHQEIKEGKRKIIKFGKIEQHLKAGEFYIADGLLLFLESVDFGRKVENLKKETLRRKDGRTRTIFENGTYSNMLYRSLGKAIDSNGKMITATDETVTDELFVNTGLVKEEDVKTGWIYVLESKSKRPTIAGIKDLYKIGFSSTSVDERIKNAKHEATYLFAEVHKKATYVCYNRNADKLEALLHRFFAKACLNIDLFDDKGQRINPREWFVVPFEVIDEAIQLILNESIVNYEYDNVNQRLKLKQDN